MGYSFVTFRGKHVRAKDYKIETWLRLLIRKIEDLSSPPDWLVEARNFWIDQLRNLSNGCMDPALDDYLISDDRRDHFVRLCVQLRTRLDLFSEVISEVFINEPLKLKSPPQIHEYNSHTQHIQFIDVMILLISERQVVEVEYA